LITQQSVELQEQLFPYRHAFGGLVSHIPQNAIRFLNVTLGLVAAGSVASGQQFSF
jgi:hypothetical protein